MKACDAGYGKPRKGFKIALSTQPLESAAYKWNCRGSDIKTPPMMAADRALTIRPAALHCVTWTPGKGLFAPDVWPPRVHTWTPGKWEYLRRFAPL